LRDLLAWLTANRRSEATFKIASQTLTDLGELRCTTAEYRDI
jgi:hypothetical protein